MTSQDKQEKDKFICEKLGVCWHERSKSPILRNGRRVFVCKHCQKLWLLCQNPDFTSEAGRMQLLKLVDDSLKYRRDLSALWTFALIELLKDDTGKFGDAAWEWLGGEG